MLTFVQQLINGLTIGSFYALIALGYSLVYGVMKLINFAHGDLFTLGCYIGYTLLVWVSAFLTSLFGIWGCLAVGMIVSAIGVGGAGILMERVAYRPIYPAGRLPAVVSALGVSIFLENFIMVVWGPRYLAYRSSFIPTAYWQIGSFRITILQVVILVLSFLLMGLLYYIIEKTTFGAAIRASSFDRDTAALMGIDINKIIFFIFSVGPALGGATGVMVGMYYRQISFTMGWVYGLRAFTATIIGGIGNIPGAMIGGIILGILEMLGAGYISAAWKDVFVFIVLILVLIFRPTGLIGEKKAEKV
ncbi:branched-chain amino acid ABC transporter permease [Candidatus Aerophobetes bacterium]|nr:branched-chain amino acid ABC transporter permease [Candidatus Aerophobetes bacterium]